MREMKKRLALLLALAVALSLGAVPALAAPEQGAQTILMDNEQVTVSVESYDPNGDWGPTFEVLLENKTDKAVFFDLEGVSVDGIMCDPLWAETVPAGKKAYSEISWYPEDLQAVGINYIQSVAGELSVSEDESYDELCADSVSWSVEPPEGAGPAAEPVQFEHGFEPVEVFTGDLVLTVADYDPAGSYDGGPAMTFYLENHTDRPAWFTIDDVSVNGFVCDPLWGETVSAGAAAYSQCSWWQDDLDQSHIDTMETVEFTASVMDDDTWDELAEPVTVTVDLTGAGAAEVTAESGDAPAGDAAEAPALDGETAALMGSVVDGTGYVNDCFGLTFAPPEDWRFYSQEELLTTQGLAADRFEGTEMEEQIRAFMDSESGFSVMMAEKEGGLQNVNAVVESLPDLGAYLSESDLLTLVEHDLGLEEGGDMSALGLEGATMSRRTFAFAGAEHESLRIDYTDTSMGIELPMYLQMVFLMQGDYVLQVTITTVFEDKTADVGAMFTLAA